MCFKENANSESKEALESCFSIIKNINFCNGNVNSRVVTYREGFPPKKSHDPFIM